MLLLLQGHFSPLEVGQQLPEPRVRGHLLQRRLWQPKLHTRIAMSSCEDHFGAASGDQSLREAPPAPVLGLIRLPRHRHAHLRHHPRMLKHCLHRMGLRPLQVGVALEMLFPSTLNPNHSALQRLPVPLSGLPDPGVGVDLEAEGVQLMPRALGAALQIPDLALEARQLGAEVRLKAGVRLRIAQGTQGLCLVLRLHCCDHEGAGVVARDGVR
mmetsp:Transcript_51275/g.122925  ORF Transcript_51275/g.122925 Transcript_51275/m.122925 type:complete len:213 (-) Transcript_51275:1168-1806(-)